MAKIVQAIDFLHEKNIVLDGFIVDHLLENILNHIMFDPKSKKVHIIDLYCAVNFNTNGYTIEEKKILVNEDWLNLKKVLIKLSELCFLNSTGTVNLVECNEMQESHKEFITSLVEKTEKVNQEYFEPLRNLRISPEFNEMVDLSKAK